MSAPELELEAWSDPEWEAELAELATIDQAGAA